MASKSEIPFEESFLSEVMRVRREIGGRFARLHLDSDKMELAVHQDLFERETALISELDGIVARYMKDSSKMASVVFEWNGKLEGPISELGKIDFLEAFPHYKKKRYPVLFAGKNIEAILFGRYEEEEPKSTEPGVLNKPKSIAIDAKTNYVFICDYGNERVQVFTKSLEYLFEFNASYPSGICICEERVYVVESSSEDYLNVYTNEGKLLQSVGKEGSGEVKFDCPCAVAASAEKNRIYVCEEYKNRVQCLNMNLTFHSFITDISRPLDVKLTKDEIVVLKYSDMCINYYNYAHQLLKEMITCERSSEPGRVFYPMNFCIDQHNNILITASWVGIFSPNGVLIHSLSDGQFNNPTGIAVDSENRIIVVSENLKQSIQLF